MVRSHICRRPGPGGTRAGAAVVAIGVGSPGVAGDGGFPIVFGGDFLSDTYPVVS